MKRINIFKSVACYIGGFFVIILMIQCIVCAKTIAADVKSGIEKCLNILIPSLFGMMALSEIILRTDLLGKISVIFFPLYKLLRMPPHLFTVFLLANFAGYPVGSRLLAVLADTKQIDKKTAESMSVFCYNSGPAFVVGTVGIAVYQSITAGLYIYISCLVANLIAAILYALLSKKPYDFIDKKDEAKAPFSENLVISVRAAGKSMATICLMVVAFSFFISLVASFGVFDISKNAIARKTIYSILEVTNITLFTADYNLMPLLTALISYGGICVLLQIKAIVNNSFSLRWFLALRFPVCILAGLVNFLLLRFFPPSVLCIKSYSFVQNDLKTSLFSCICLIFMVIIIFFQKNTGNSEKDML